MLFVGDDWAEAHHDIEIVDDNGTVLARKRLPEGVAGIEALHAFLPSASTPTARCAAWFFTVPSWRTLQTRASRKITG